jgi:hypothetical protein
MRLLSPFLVLALSASAALAGDVKPLPPSPPAGVKHAQEIGHDTILYIGLGAAAIAGIAIALSQDDDKVSPKPPTTTTSTGTV